MTLRCPECDALELELLSFSGGEAAAVERYECQCCGNRFTNVLSRGEVA